MLKQSLQQKLLQKLSPLQIQVIKLLEIPTTQLEQRIKEEVEENPVLEMEDNSRDSEEEDNSTETDNEKDEMSIDAYIQDEDIPAYKLSSRNFSKDDKQEDVPFSSGTTFHEHLVSQMGLRIMDERQSLIAEYIIGNIDEDGYLRREVDEIIDDIAFAQNVEVDEKEGLEVLKMIQDFDPPGVGARDLRECLLLQLDRKEDHGDPILQKAYELVKNYFEEFTRKHYDKIEKRMHLEEGELKEILDEILRLNPKPGSSYSNPVTKTVQHIIPDFILEFEEGKPKLSLNNRNVPELHISNTYAEMFEDYQANKKNQSKQQKEALMFVKQKLDSAKWFIDAIKQRQNTLMTVMQAILDYQYEFFLEGDETKLKPMILKDIADRTGLDISTISRVSNSKYIQTHFGIYPLKYFFSEGLQTESGEEVSTREIKSILQDCIDNEDKRKPLTDDKLAQILQEKSYNIARRTVAKYREQLNIPVARLRKEW